MTDNKFTDKEIIESFNHCLNSTDDICDPCVFKGVICDRTLRGKIETLKLVADVLNRQQERIITLTNSRDNWRRIAEEFDKASRETEKEFEGLQAEIERLNSCVKSEDEVRAIMKAQMTPMVKEITNEQIDLANKLGKISGILEFAERLKGHFNPDNSYDIKQYIDTLAEEMVGEE
jgi:chromosome segregation ATPase